MTDTSTVASVSAEASAAGWTLPVAVDRQHGDTRSVQALQGPAALQHGRVPGGLRDHMRP